MYLPELRELLELQDGVVARRQLLEMGLAPHEIRRMLRRRELVRVHAGVYVTHTGPLTRKHRHWVAVLAGWPAALCRQTVLSSSDDGPIHVAVDFRQTLAAPSGVVVHRTADLQSRVRWNASPPEVRYEHAAIDVALAQPDVAAAFRVLADTVQSRRTTVAKLQETLAARARVSKRPLLLELLEDLATGACSVLERQYLLLERRHGLPTRRPQVSRQRPAEGPFARYQDVRYEEFDVAVELDGGAFHDNATARDTDAGRDLDHVVATDGLTVRLTYGLVFRDGCATIRKVGLLLQRRGWAGEPTRCRECP